MKGAEEQRGGGAAGPRKAFLLRLDPALYETMQRWAAAELRSLNAQIEFVLRAAVRRSGRVVEGGAEE